MKKKMIRRLVTSVCVLCVFLTGCSSTKKDEKSESVKNFSMDSANECAPMEESNYYGSEEEFSRNEVETKSEVTNDINNEQSNEIVNVSMKQKSMQKIIRTVNMGIETEYYKETVDALESLCMKMDGYIGSSNMENNDYRREYTVEMRIPQANLDTFLNYISKIGNIKVQYKQENASDVTLQYTDSVEHKKSLEVERDRIVELIAQADSLEYVIPLEDKLTEIRYQINSYESEIRRLDDLVSYSTVNLTVTEVQQIAVKKDASVKERIESGFEKKMTKAKEAFADFTVWFVVNLPVIIIVLIIVFVGIKIGKSRYKNNKLTKDSTAEIKEQRINPVEIDPNKDNKQ